MNQLISFKTLYQAYCVCRRRKRRTANAQRYEMRLFDNLYATQAALTDRSYLPSPCIHFVAQRPKAREIHAADFSDRVVHHWLVPQLEALFEPVFIHDVYSNRQGKGSHKAVDRLQSFMHSVGHGGWYLQLDIANFFNSIDRALLFKQLQWRLSKALKQGKINTAQASSLRWLSHVLLKHDASRQARYRGDPALLQRVPPHKRLGAAGVNKGLPIGNLTSQFFANVYLNPFDQFVKHELKCRHYLRYVDDFVLLADNPHTLMQWRGQIADFLNQQLHLSLKDWAAPKPVGSGADFLGYIVRPHYRLVRRRVVGHLREKLHVFQARLLRGNPANGYSLCLLPDSMAQLQAVLASYRGHVNHAHSYRLQQQLQHDFPWLKLLAGYQPKPNQINGYRSQIHFFQQHYPYAELIIQRGYQFDRIDARQQPASVAGAAILTPAVELSAAVKRAHIVECGHLKGGLKRRIVHRLIIKSGVELCPHRA